MGLEGAVVGRFNSMYTNIDPYEFRRSSSSQVEDKRSFQIRHEKGRSSRVPFLSVQPIHWSIRNAVCIILYFEFSCWALKKRDRWVSMVGVFPVSREAFWCPKESVAECRLV